MKEQLLKECDDYQNAKTQVPGIKGYGNNADATAAVMGMAGTPRRPSTLIEEAEGRMRHHAEAHGKSSAAYEFLNRHPEFDEFVRLVRAGSIQF